MIIKLKKGVKYHAFIPACDVKQATEIINTIMEGTGCIIVRLTQGKHFTHPTFLELL